MKKTLFLVSLALLTGFSSCRNPKEKPFDIFVVQHTFSPDISSASGAGMFQNDVYVVGDDLPDLIRLDPERKPGGRIKLSEIPVQKNGRMAKNIKPDFESMEFFNDRGIDKVLVLSSGSKQPARDTAFQVRFDVTWLLKKKNIRPLYLKIKSAAGMTGDEEINIEGLAISDKKVYLLQRGNLSGNFIAAFDKLPFMMYLDSDKNPLPGVKIYKFNLPEYNGVPSGFSGACMLPGNRGLLFTASMEDTGSSYEDGAVLGSYIGMIPLSELPNGKYFTRLFTKKDEPVAKKLEGITVKGFENKILMVVTVSDNDDGTSDIYELGLTLNDKLIKQLAIE